MRKIRNKICILGLIVILLCNTLLPQHVYAEDVEDGQIKAEIEQNMEESADIFPGENVNWLQGIVSILLDPIKLLIVLPGMIVNGITSGIGGMEGNDGNTFISLYEILFNELAITDINILEFSWGLQRHEVATDGTIGKMRTNIAYWYYGIRNLAIVILLCVLIYIGIRMAISTVAEDRARYKQLLMYWFTAVVLVFMLHYIIILTINVNSALVSIIKTATDSSTNSAFLKAYNGVLLEKTFGWSNIVTGFASAFIYTIINGMTFAFLMLYIRRMIILSFLILIAPIITITYPIDKVGDRKITSIKYMA